MLAQQEPIGRGSRLHIDLLRRSQSYQSSHYGQQQGIRPSSLARKVSTTPPPLAQKKGVSSYGTDTSSSNGCTEKEKEKETEKPHGWSREGSFDFGQGSLLGGSRLRIWLQLEFQAEAVTEKNSDEREVYDTNT